MTPTCGPSCGLHRLIRKHRADIFLPTRSRDYWLGGFANLGTGARYVMRMGITRDLPDTIKERLRYGTFPDGIVVNAEAVRQSLIRYSWVKADRVRVIYNGVDTTPVTPLPPLKQPGEFLILAAGRVESDKGFDILVEAMALAVKRAPELRCVIYGRGDMEKALFQRIGELRLDDHVRLGGFTTTLGGALAQADLAVSSSYREGVSNFILESWSAGVPIIATAIPGSAEIVTDGVRGRLVPPGEPVAMAEAIVEAFQHPEKRAAWIAAGREAIANTFNWTDNGHQSGSIFRGIVTLGNCVLVSVSVRAGCARNELYLGFSERRAEPAPTQHRFIHRSSFLVHRWLHGYLPQIHKSFQALPGAARGDGDLHAVLRGLQRAFAVAGGAGVERHLSARQGQQRGGSAGAGGGNGRVVRNAEGVVVASDRRRRPHQHAAAAVRDADHRLCDQECLRLRADAFRVVRRAADDPRLARPRVRSHGAAAVHVLRQAAHGRADEQHHERRERDQRHLPARVYAGGARSADGAHAARDSVFDFVAAHDAGARHRAALRFHLPRHGQEPEAQERPHPGAAGRAVVALAGGDFAARGW